jgi:hypothetical protein
VNLGQPVTYIVLGTLGLVATAIGLLACLVSGTPRIVLRRVSGISLFLLTLVGLIFGWHHLFVGDREKAGAFLVVSIALLLMGWLILAMDTRGELDITMR